MALAILRLDDSPGEDLTSAPAGHSLVVDTGTNTHYRIHFGKEVRREDGFTLLDGPYWSSPLRVNPQAGRHVDTRTRVVLDPSLVTEPGTLVQLETCRGPDGKGPAWSVPLRLPGFTGLLGAASALRRQRMTIARSTPTSVTMSTDTAAVRTVALAAPRMVPVRSATDVFSRPASIGDLIAQVVQAAAPIALNLLNQNAPQGASTDPTASVLTDLLRTVLGALAKTPTGAATASPPAPAAPTPPAGTPGFPQVPTPSAIGATKAAAPSTSVQSSVAVRELNRFVPYSRPMIFGVDDALIGALVGPVLQNVVGPFVQVLPQLLNAVNQQKLARQALTDQQVKDLLSQVDRTTLMEQLIGAQNQPANPGIQASNLDALAGLLQATPTAPMPTGTPATAVSRPTSVETVTRPTPIASKAVLSMLTGPSITRLGLPQVVFSRVQAPTFRFRLDVGTSGPTTPLPRAILDLCMREPGGAHDLLRRTERLTALAPGSPVAVTLTADEAASLPVDTDLEVLACLRWRGTHASYQASCSQPMVLGSAVLLRERGDVVGTPVELTDMGRFRGFWNKVWASATLDTSRMWGLDLALRYSVVTTASDRGNGLMESRLQHPTTDQPDEALRVTTRGKLKSGLEISLAELNKLLPLWPGEQPLPAGDLAAFGTLDWLAGTGGDVVTQVKMDGKRGTTGQLWVVPVPRLRAFSLSQVIDVDSNGQVTATTDRTVHFPVVESVRLLGLRSSRADGGDAADVSEAQPAYRFDGYDVVLNQLVGLDPALPVPKAAG
jgi:hypothetical protein